MAKSRLEQALDNVQAEILVRLTGVAFAFGAEHIESNDAAPAPRVVWVRATDLYSEPDAGADVPSVATRGAVVVAHCTGAADVARGWDTHDAAAEKLVDVVVASLVAVLGTSGLPASGEWLENALVGVGSACLLSFTVAQPVPALEPAEPATVVIEDTAFDPTGAVAGDGILQAGEP